MVIPVLEATLHSLARDRIARLGGLERISLRDLAREFREGSGDAGICFEYSVHQAIANQNSLIWPLASEVLEDFCSISQGADSILFGPEKDGVIPILENVENALTDESRVYVGNRGQPPKLKRYIPKIIKAFRRKDEKNKLPRSISGLWKADLFMGNAQSERWVGTTVKINASDLKGAQGLRIGIYPKQNARDSPRMDGDLNLVRLPLPYDSAFMEVFYKSFFLVRAFLNADAEVPKPVDLPDSEDRLITSELQARRDFPLVEVLHVLKRMAQPDLLETGAVEQVAVTAQLSEAKGLQTEFSEITQSDYVSLTPMSRTT
ncbi:hypothetical protein [Myxococcus faecalis]|uniref:hypothetical protein n=1 Tax=Myxococcus faecalis TaxID=3115646 RepID=UPI003CE7EC34